MKKLSLPEWALLNNIPITRAKKLALTLNCPGLEIKITGRGKDYLIPENYKPPEDDTIACMVCGKRFQLIADRHLKLHDMSMSQYREAYPDAPMIIKSVGDKISKSKIGHVVTQEMKDAVSKANTGNKYSLGRVLSEDTKIKIGNSKRGRPNSIEHNASISLAQLGTVKSDQSKQKMRDFHANVSDNQRIEMNNKSKATILDRYGVENIMEVPHIREKIEKTNMERYGELSPLSSQNIQQKARDTLFERTGFYSPFSDPEIQARIANTNIERYGNANTTHIARAAFESQTGVANPFSMKEYQDKAAETMLERYGVEKALSNSIILTKMSEDYFVKTGYTNPAKNPEVKKKALETNFRKYNRKSFNQIHFSLELCAFLEDKEAFAYYMSTTSLRDASVDLRMGYDTVRKYCDKYGIERPRSSYETAICGYLTEWGINHHGSDRTIIKPLEIDIVVPRQKIGIEFCGLYWHSDRHPTKDSRYHINKVNRSELEGYRLITIFEDEWIYKKEIVLSRLKHLFGLSEKGVGARKCEIRKISGIMAKGFFDQTHIQGAGQYGFVNYGAFYENILVGAMSFSKAGRFDKSGPEMLRFSTDGKSYPGLASKLFKQFVEDYAPERVITYADRRWSQGDVYANLGFKESSDTSTPGYFYFNQNREIKRESRWKFQRKNVATLVETDIREDGSKKTESEMMKELGYDRIWDCGHIKFVWEKSRSKTYKVIP